MVSAAASACSKRRRRKARTSARALGEERSRGPGELGVVLVHLRQVWERGVGQEHDLCDSPIGRVRGASYQVKALEPVDELRDRAGGQHEPGAEVALRQWTGQLEVFQKASRSARPMPSSPVIAARNRSRAIPNKCSCLFRSRGVASVMLLCYTRSKHLRC